MTIQRLRFPLTAIGVGVLLAAWAIGFMSFDQQPEAVAQQPLPNPPEGQTYMGAKQCASCHFDQYLKWRQTKHSKAFDILPVRYKQDASCLKCHTTAYGQATGYKGAATPDLVGTSCEACHGPGSKHGEIAKGYGNRTLTAQEQAYVRSTIFKVLPANSCVECHIEKGHKDHPPFSKS
jgi:hypothetical protein